MPVWIGIDEMDAGQGQLALVHALVNRPHIHRPHRVTLKGLPGAGHEIVNETNRDKVKV